MPTSCYYICNFAVDFSGAIIDPCAIDDAFTDAATVVATAVVYVLMAL